MNHIKDNWVEGEVLHASDLNEMAGLINELIDSQEEIINDEVESDSSTFSSNKTTETIEEAAGALVNDEEASEDTVYSSSKIEEKAEDVKVKIEKVSALPAIGEENTLYLTPSLSMAYSGPSAWMRMHENEDGIIECTVMSNRDFTEPSYGIRIGDVFKYKKTRIDTTNQICLATYKASYGDVKYNNDSELFSGNYSVGETFKVTSVDSGHNLLVSSYNINDIRISSSYIYGISSNNQITIQAGKVYRMTGYYSVPDEKVAAEYRESRNYFIATFEEVTGATSADHETNYLGSLFAVNKPMPSYVVFSEIDKDKIMGSLFCENFESEKILAQVLDGVSSTIELQDGHYYKLKDIYQLQSKNMTGNYIYYPMYVGIGARALVYEEVEQPDFVTFDDIEVIPTAIMTETEGNLLYRKGRGSVPILESGGTMGWTYYAYESSIPCGIKVGDVVKIVCGPVKLNEEICSRYLTEIEGNQLLLDEEGYVIGAKGTQIAEKGECYRLTGFYKCKIGGEFSRYFVNPRAYTFEKVSRTETQDYKMPSLPAISFEYAQGAEYSDYPLYDKWMWIEGGWELIGNIKLKDGSF